MPVSGAGPPIDSAFTDLATGKIAEVWRIFLRDLQGAVVDRAPVDATYWTSRSTSGLSGEVNLGALASGYLKLTTAVGIGTPSTVPAIPPADVTGLVATLAGIAASLALVTSGTYTPALTNVANLAASTAYVCQFLRVGTLVTVSGRVDVDPTLTATDTQLGISLPVASNFATADQCAGTAWAPTLTSEGGAILADLTNDRAVLQWRSVDITNAARYFTFSYQVI